MSPARRIAVTLLAPVPWAVLLFELLVVVPRYVKQFDLVHFQPPRLTAAIFDFTRLARANILLTFLAAFVVMVLSVVVTHRVQGAKRTTARRWLVLSFVFGVPVALFALIWVGVELPYRKLAEGMAR